MKIRYYQVIELINALRALDGYQSKDGFVPYILAVDTVDKIAHNICELKKYITQFDEWKSSFVKQLGVNESHPRWAEATQHIQAKLLEEIEVDLKPLALSELRANGNYVFPGLLEKLNIIIQH